MHATFSESLSQKYPQYCWEFHDQHWEALSGIISKKRGVPSRTGGGKNSGNALEASNAFDCRAWGTPVVLSRRIPGNALIAFPGSFRNFSGIYSGKSQPYGGVRLIVSRISKPEGVCKVPDFSTNSLRTWPSANCMRWRQRPWWTFGYLNSIFLVGGRRGKGGRVRGGGWGSRFDLENSGRGGGRSSKKEEARTRGKAPGRVCAEGGGGGGKIWGRTNRVFGKPCFCALPKRGHFDENGANDEFAFYPLKTRASLLRPPKTTKMTKMAGVTQEKAWFRKGQVCSSLKNVFIWAEIPTKNLKPTEHKHFQGIVQELGGVSRSCLLLFSGREKRHINNIRPKILGQSQDRLVYVFGVCWLPWGANALRSPNNIIWVTPFGNVTSISPWNCGWSAIRTSCISLPRHVVIRDLSRVTSTLLITPNLCWGVNKRNS